MEYKITDIKKALDRAISSYYIKAHYGDLNISIIWYDFKKHLREQVKKKP